MKRKILCILTVVIVAMAFMPMTASAASKTMKAYDGVYKSGKYAYCISESGIYKVNIKNGKKKVLAKKESLIEGWYPHAMIKKGSWLYYLSSGPVGNSLERINVNNKKTKVLVYADSDASLERYMIKGNKIYYTQYKGKVKYRVMKLNGKGKKKTSTKPLMKTKHSNAKGYKIITKNYSSGEVVKTWLKTPKKKIYLGKVTF